MAFILIKKLYNSPPHKQSSLPLLTWVVTINKNGGSVNKTLSELLNERYMVEGPYEGCGYLFYL